MSSSIMNETMQQAPTLSTMSATADAHASAPAAARSFRLTTSEPIRADVGAGRAVIARLANAWDDLHARSSFSPPHVARPWLEAWMDRNAGSATPCAVTAWQADRLVGLLVLAIRRRWGLRAADICGAARPSYQGVLLDGACPAAADALARACDAHRLFDLILLENVSSVDDGTRRFVDRLRKDGWRIACAPRTVCHRIRLASSFDAYLREAHSKKARYNLRRLERIARRDHAVDVQRYDGPAVDDGVMLRVAEIQRRSWMPRRGAAMFLDMRWREFVKRIARASLASVWILAIDERDAAFVIATFDKTCVYYEWTGFDLAFRDLSVGQLITKHVIDTACDEGFSALDFGQGDGAYKRFWANDCHFVDRMGAARGTAGSAILRVHRTLWSLPSGGCLRRTYRGLRRMRRRLAQRHSATPGPARS
jgi:CelD/BcsL family acetyltransferase involved in cellulose biosynthesis